MPISFLLRIKYFMMDRPKLDQSRNQIITMPYSKLKLERVNRMLRAMREVGQVLNRETDLPTLLTEVCQCLARTRGYVSVWIGEPDATTKIVRPLASSGVHEKCIAHLTIRWDDSPFGHGPSGTALRERRPVIFADAANDPRFAPWRETLLTNGVVAIASFPIQYQNHLLGVLTLKTDGKNIFDDEESELLARFAEDIGCAWQRIVHEQARQKAEESLRTLLATIPDLVFFKDGEGRWLTINEAAKKVFHLEHYPWEGRTDAAMAADRPAYRETYENCQRSDELAWAAGGPSLVVERTVDESGTVREFEVQKVPFFFPDGRRKGLVIVGRDMTERRQAEAAQQLATRLAEAEQHQAEVTRAHDFYLELLQNSPSLVWRAGTDGQCDWFNATWLAFTGRTMAEEIGEGWSAGVHPMDLERCLNHYRGSFGRREAFVMDYRLRRHDGQYRWIRDHGRPITSVTGEFAGYIGDCYDIHEMKLAAEQAFQRQVAKADDLEETQRMLIESIPDNVIFKDGAGRWLVTNAPAREFFQVENTDWYGKTDGELALGNPRLKDLYSACIASDAKAWSGRERSVVTERGPGLDGTLQEHEVVKVPLFYPNGERKALLVIGRDVTAKRRAEKEVAVTGLMTKLSRDIMLRIRRGDGRILDANEAAVAAYGYSRRELLSLSIFDLREKASLEEMQRQLEAAFAEGGLFEIRHFRKDGSCFPVEVSSQGFLYEGEESVVSIVRDITARKQAEAQMNLLSVAVNAAANGIFLTDNTGKIVWINKGFTQLTGFTGPEIIGKKPDVFKSGLHPKNFYKQVWDAILRGKVWQGELINRRKDGTFYHELKTITPVTNEAGKITHFLCVQENISLQKQLLQEVHHAKEMAQQKAAQLKAIMESPQGIIMFSLDKNYTYTEFTQTHQETIQKIWGQKIAIGKNMLEIIGNPADRARAQQNFDRALRGENFVLIEEYGDRMLHRAYYEDHYSPISDASGAITGLTVFVIDVTERIRTVHALQEREEIYSNIVNQAADAIALIDMATNRFVEFNEVTHASLGYTREEFLQLGISDIQAEYDAQAIAEKNEQIRRQNGAVFQTKHRHRNGEIRDVRVSVRIFSIREREYLAAVWQDITQHQRDAAALAQSAAEIQDLYENAPCGYHSLNAEGCFIRINNTELDWLGYSRQEILGQPITRFLAPEEQVKFARDFQRLQEAAEVHDVERTYVRKDGVRITVNVSASIVKDSAGRVVETRASVFDISARRKAELKLAHAAEVISDLYNNAPCGYHSLDLEGRFTHINDTELKRLGYTRDELIGQPITCLIAPEEVAGFKKNFQQFMERGTTYVTAERTYLCKDGRRLSSSIASQIEKDDMGRVIGCRTTVMDNTERKRLNDERQLALLQAEQASRAKSDFLAKMSHELRTPMNGVLGYTQILQRDPALSRETKTKLGIIYQSGQNLMTILNCILDLSKIESGRMTVQTNDFNLPKLVDSVIELFQPVARAKQLALTSTKLGQMPLLIRADQEKIRQILANLLSNGVKFTHRGGVQVQVFFHQAAATRGRLVLDVIDTGPGMTSAEMEHLFEKFYQTKSGVEANGGTGLGLAISRQYARLLGGDITVHSQWEHGTTFRLEIPVDLVPGFLTVPSRVVPRLQSLAPEHAGCRVLVVDDKAINSDLLVELLQTAGFDACAVTSGPEAIVLAPSWQPQLILMDTRMPEMDGNETTRHLRADPRCRKIKIITVSATAYPEDQAQALAAGSDDFIAKPVDDQELFGKITGLLGVRFTTDADNVATPPAAAVPLNSQSVASLPAACREPLRKAVTTGNFGEVIRLLEEIKPTHSDLAEALQVIAREFDADRLMELLDNGGSGPKA